MNPTIPATAGFNDKIVSGIYSGLKKIPYVKGKISTPKGEKITKKVINIAIEVFKVIGIIAAGAAFGALVGVGFGGPIPLAISIVVGGVGAGIAYGGAKLATMAITKFAYPSTRNLKEKAISKDQWLDDRKVQAFEEALKTFQNEKWFKSWLKLKGFKKCNNFLRRRFNKGFCHGESYALLKLIKDHRKASSKDLLDGLKAKDVFEKQIQEIIRADFATILKKNKRTTIKGIQRSTLKRQLATLTRQTQSIAGMKALGICNIDKATLLNPTHFKGVFSVHRAKVTKRRFAGIIRLEGRDRAHTLFIQYKQGRYRIYDGYNARRTGFYEFPNEQAFQEGLYRHLRKYVKVPNLRGRTYHKASLQFYSFK